MRRQRSSSRPPSRPRSRPVSPPGGRAGDRGFPASAASRRPDNGSCPDPWNSSIFAGGETFASKIANNAAEFDSPEKTGAYIAAGLVLFVVTFLVNSAARIIVARSGPGGKRPRRNRRAGSSAATEGATS